MTPRIRVAAGTHRNRNVTALALALAVSLVLVFLPNGDGVGSARAASSPSGFKTLFGTRTPLRAQVAPVTHRVEVGTRFAARRPGRVHGVRLWRTAGSVERQVALLRNGKGEVLARVSFTPKAGRGWQRVLFPTSVRLRKGHRYVVSRRLTRGTRVVTRMAAPASASRALRLIGGVRHARALRGSERARPSTQFWIDPLFVPRRSGKSPDPTSGTTPTVTRTQPTAVPGECSVVPSACGYPDVTNTGVAPGAQLLKVPAEATSGPGWSWIPAYSSVFVDGAGAVLDGLDIAGGVAINAPNVTLQNSRVTACGGGDDSDVVAIRHRPSEGLDASGARVLHNEINGTPVGCSRRARSGVRDVYGAAPNALVEGNNIYGAGKGITIEYQGLVRDNWVHDLGHVAGDHHSGISNHGGAAGVVIRHNTVLLHGQKFAGGGGVSGALTVYSDFAHAQNVTLEDNLISGGSYVVYGGDSGDASSTPATNIKILRNRFVCGDWLYGPLAAFSKSSAGNEFTGNVCDVTAAPVRP